AVHALRDYQKPPAPRTARIPIDFLLVATLFFAGGVIAAPWVIGEAVGYFYQPHILALVHTFTLGWITAAIMGVMYRYVPALARRELPFPRLAFPQLVLFVVGIIGMIMHFAIGIWTGTWSAAIVVIISILMFAANLLPCLWPHTGRGVAETGMFLSIVFLLTAATIGFVLALDKTFGFLGGSVITNLAGHAHFAAVGWVTLTICAVSYRMLPAFLLPKVQLPKNTLWQLYALALGVVGLGVTLFTGLPGLTGWAVLIVLALVAYIASVGRIVRTRRMPLDWTARHALAGVIWLLVAGGLGIALTRLGTQSVAGARIAAAYGTLGLAGWIGNFIIGMSYHLFPGFVSRARTALKWRAITVADLTAAGPRWFVFAAFNAGLALLVAGFLTGSVKIAIGAAALIEVGGLIYAAMTLWTLSYAYRRTPRIAATSPAKASG
ncbi:MAG: hypothetical protein ACREQN_14700, partial [Candidatus Binataceae bacterium]